MTIKPLHRPTRSQAARRGFTLPEYVISVALALIVSGGMLAGYLFSGRMYALADAKLDTCDDIRGIGALFTHDVRTAADFDIGDGDATSFQRVAANRPRRGNALQIYPTDNTNIFVRYFLEPSTQLFKAVETGSTNIVTLADSVTNTIVFTAEDPWGNVTTNERPMEIIGLLLQFNQNVFKGGRTGRTNYSDSFQLNIRANKRTSFGYQVN
jgi:hypothetical protein